MPSPPLSAVSRSSVKTSCATPWLQRIACISTSRADAGIYRPLLRALGKNPRWQISVLAGGTHHEEAYGRTRVELNELASIEIIEVLHFSPGDSPLEIARTAGQAVIEFSRALSEARPDLVFVLGDRTEMLAAALAATIHKIPIAHLHGGDTTLGAYDENCRHAITKLAHLHFPALPEHAERIASMGEERWRIHTVGALALDDLREFRPESREALGRALGLDLSRPFAIVVFHPETLSPMPADRQVAEVIAGLDGWGGGILIISPNADVGRDAVCDALQAFATTRPDTVLIPSLPQYRFWSCLSHASVLVGNSSAGIIEAASFKLPVVNIGDRQEGRVRGSNVIDASVDREAIHVAIKKAVAAEFSDDACRLTNIYGDGSAATRILDAIRKAPAKESLIRKVCSR